MEKINAAEYDRIIADVEADRFTPTIKNVTFDLEKFKQDIDGYNNKIEGVLRGT